MSGEALENNFARWRSYYRGSSEECIRKSIAEMMDRTIKQNMLCFGETGDLYNRETLVQHFMAMNKQEAVMKRIGVEPTYEVDIRKLGR